MGRVIKFRFWDIQGKRFVQKGAEVKYRVEEELCTNRIVRAQQFTGLLDKNGKDIYEGDVCEYEEPRFESAILRSVVMFLGGSFGLDGSNGHMTPSFYHLGHFAANDIEVIGNIYENPELIKQ